MATQAQRIADLERNMVSLRGEFAAVGAALDCAFAAGRAFETRQPGAGTPPTLRLIPGGLAAREAEAAPELEAGL